MSDEQTQTPPTDTPVATDASGNAVATQPDANLPPVDPATQVTPPVPANAASASTSPLDLEYVRSELDMIRFSIAAGTSTGLDRLGQLQRYIEARMTA
jgi:hypothetical protein